MSSKKIEASFIECSYRFLEHLRVIHEMSKHTIRCYTADLNHLKEYIEEEVLEIESEARAPRVSHRENYQDRDSSRDGKIPLGSISRTSIRKFLRYLGRRDLDSKTIARHVSSLKSFFKFAMIQKDVTENPMKHIEKPKSPKLIPYYVTEEQIELLLKQPDPRTLFGFRDRCIIEVLYSTGIRVNELVNLNIEDFDQKKCLLLIKGKRERQRLLPISETASKWLKDYITHPGRFVKGHNRNAQIDESAVFLNKFGKRISTRSVARNFEKYTETIGLKGKVTPHIIRHTIATHWLENGMDIKTIKVLLGHDSFSMTTIYTQVSTKLKRESHKKAALLK
jgi:integrase/recombinase XerC